jgi:hypothetical protein
VKQGIFVKQIDGAGMFCCAAVEQGLSNARRATVPVWEGKLIVQLQCSIARCYSGAKEIQ